MFLPPECAWHVFSIPVLGKLETERRRAQSGVMLECPGAYIGQPADSSSAADAPSSVSPAEVARRRVTSEQAQVGDKRTDTATGAAAAGGGGGGGGSADGQAIAKVVDAGAALASGGDEPMTVSESELRVRWGALGFSCVIFIMCSPAGGTGTRGLFWRAHFAAIAGSEPFSCDPHDAVCGDCASLVAVGRDSGTRAQDAFVLRYAKRLRRDLAE